MEIDWHAGERDELRALFALAEDSPRRLETALRREHVLVARDGEVLVGCLQLVHGPSAGERELLTLAVGGQPPAPGHRPHAGGAGDRRVPGGWRHHSARGHRRVLV